MILVWISWAVATPVKYDRGMQRCFDNYKNWENNGMKGIVLVTPAQVNPQAQC